METKCPGSQYLSIVLMEVAGTVLINVIVCLLIGANLASIRSMSFIYRNTV